MNKYEIEELTEDSQTLREKYADQLPRERLLAIGAKELSKRELLALLLGTGKKGLNVLDLSAKILESVNDNLDTLARYDVRQIMQLFSGMGIGSAKAITIVAAMELGSRRIGDKPSSNISRITESNDIFNYMYPRLMNLDHEECHVILMNNANTIISTHMLSKGGISATVIDVRLLMRHILLQSATAVAICHNHPSGMIVPSENDNIITRSISTACKTLGIQFLDHVIIGNGNYYSYADNGCL